MSDQKILVTGAAGYVGGSLIMDLASRNSGPLNSVSILGAVRSDEQRRILANANMNAIQLDLRDDLAVTSAIVHREIDIVVHTASAFDSQIASALITALGQRRNISGKETFFIHSSVANIYSAEAGWPYGEVRDTDRIQEMQKDLPGPHPVRDTNIVVVDLARAQGVTSLNVALPTVYGRGSGLHKRLSSNLPSVIRASMKNSAVYRFDQDSNPSLAHISDIVALYALLLENITRGKQIQTNENGLYIAMAHTASWWDVTRRLATAMLARGLVADDIVRLWPSDEMAAEELGFPTQLVRAMGTIKIQAIPMNAARLGWRPQWDEPKFLASLDQEIQDVLDLYDEKPASYD